jgi:hypothetical protein
VYINGLKDTKAIALLKASFPFLRTTELSLHELSRTPSKKLKHLI